MHEGALYKELVGLLNLESLIGGKCQGRPTSLHTRAWEPEGPMKFDLNGWTNLHESWHGVECIIFHGLLNFVSSQSQRGGWVLTRRPWHFKISSQPLINYNLLCRRARMNRMMLKSHSVESPNAYVFTLHLKARISFNFQWFGLQMSFNGAQNFMVTALGHSVKWLTCTPKLLTGLNTSLDSSF